MLRSSFRHRHLAPVPRSSRVRGIIPSVLVLHGLAGSNSPEGPLPRNVRPKGACYRSPGQARNRGCRPGILTCPVERALKGRPKCFGTTIACPAALARPFRASTLMVFGNPGRRRPRGGLLALGYDRMRLQREEFVSLVVNLIPQRGTLLSPAWSTRRTTRMSSLLTSQ